MFANKKLIITGGTGSFGNAVLNRFLHTDIAEIRIFSCDEKKQDDMRKRYNNSKLKFYIGDVRDQRSLAQAFCGVDFCFHASNFSSELTGIGRRSGDMAGCARI